jgi:hypothetical protein
MTSIFTRDQTRRFRGWDLATGPDRSAEVTGRVGRDGVFTVETIKLSDVRVTLDDVPSVDLPSELHDRISRRANALMEDNVRAVIRGEPMRHEMKPARARRVK